jgi:hypothetical protein
MKKLTFWLLLLPTLGFLMSPLLAQEKKARVSPHETINATIDGDQVTVVYGRPYMKDPKTGEKRKIWGGLVPFDRVWRLGADEATLFTTEQPLELGGKSIASGTYSLFMLPRADGGASLVVNKQTGQWGTKYDEKQDLVRVDMKKDAISVPVEQLTIALDKTPDGGGVLKVMWEGIQYSVDLRMNH